MTVSRSITQMPRPVASSSITLLSLVSLCVTRSGISPRALRSSRREKESARASTNAISAFTSFARLSASFWMAA